MSNNNLVVSSSPHVRSNRTTRAVMLDVIIALIPALIASIVFFGYRALILTIVSVASAVIFEYLFCLVTKKPATIGDLSAVVTGMLLAFNLPASLPVWIAVIGSFIAIVITKMLFGGLGYNFANPAIVGRIVLALSFTSAMSNWVAPMSWAQGGFVATATPLASGSTATLLNAFLGNVGGCLGETSALALLIGGIYLVIRKVIKPIIPIAYMATVAVFSLIGGYNPLMQLCTGGLMLGAIFMATDYVTSPVTNKGKLIFGIGCGIFTVLIRFFASAPEGVSYAILLMNLLTPYIDRLTGTRPFGKAGKKNG